MNIILLQDVESLGQAGDIVKVKPGFARNKLIPGGLALRASKRNLALADERKRVFQNKTARETAANKSLAEKLSKTEITIEVKVGEEEKMFGSITSNDIHKSLKGKGIMIDRNSILLDSPIKSLGIFHVKIQLSKEHECDVKVYVIKS